MSNMKDTKEEDPIGTKSQLENGFWSILGGEIPVKEPPKTSKVSQKQNSTIEENKELIANKEKSRTLEETSIGELYDLYEDTAALCVKRDADEEILNIIRKIEKILVNIGEQITPFDPLSHLSGLDKPDLTIGAKAVVANTKNFYKIGSVDCQIEENGTKITVAFKGCKNGTNYIANGLIEASFWTGNEAIDYIYSAGSGRMSVKAFENNKWQDKSDNFNISWELNESNKSEESEEIKEEPKEKIETLAENTNKSIEIEDILKDQEEGQEESQEDFFNVQEIQEIKDNSSEAPAPSAHTPN